MTAITCDQVSKQFGGRVVLDRVDLDVAEGEFVSVIGRSGTGKSTLLRLIAGLAPTSSGTIRASGEIAFAFQEPRLLPWLTVAQNVAFGLPPSGRDDLVGAALTEVGLEDRSDAWPLTLSGGQAQRVSLARALVHRPRLLLLDEPFGALDALTRLDMQNLVGELREAHGWTVVLVTHDVHEATRLSDRVIVLDEGRIRHAVSLPGRGPRPLESPGLGAVVTELLGSLGVPTHATQSTYRTTSLSTERR